MISFTDLWHDDALRKELLTAPRPVLRRLGFAIPDDVAVKALGSRGKPSDPVATLVQIVLEREALFSFFFMPSPLQPSAQQAAYGITIGDRIDDPVFEQRVRADAETALRALEAVPADI